MRIDRIDLYRVAMPLITPWRTAYGEDAVIESVLVKMTSGDVEGWGEASPLRAPTYSPEWAAGVFSVARNWLVQVPARFLRLAATRSGALRCASRLTESRSLESTLAPRLIGQTLHSGAELQQLLSVIKGNYFARAALDLAWWDLHARYQNRPLYRVLGGSSAVVAVGADFGVPDSLDALLRDIGAALAAGFPRVKLKFRPGWDLPMVRAVRQAFPDAVFHIDCNSAYHLDDAPLFRTLDEFNLAMYEQPLAHDDLLDHAELQKQVRTPICLDESITSLDRTRQALAIGACRYVNVKPGRVGGLTNALAIHDLCRQHGVPCWVGGMLESAIGAAHCIALATLPNFTYPADIFPSSRFYRQDLAEPEIVLSGQAQMRAADVPGIGVVPNPQRLARMTLDHEVVLPTDV